MSVPTGVRKIGVSAVAKTWAFGEMEGIGTPYGGGGEAGGQVTSLIGEAAPEFRLERLEGDPFKLSESRGKEVVVLDFWATWCGPCIAALPEVMAAVDEFEGQGVRLIGVNQQEAPGKISQFLEAKGWDLDVVLDADRQNPVSKQFGVTGIPTTFVIGKDGKVLMMHSGFSPSLKGDLINDIKRALK